MKPIIFSTKMVQAILEGRKTQTRRIIPVRGTGAFCELKDNLGYPASEGKTWAGFGMKEDPIYYQCPYGKVGDTLWVREAFAPNYFDNGKCGYRADWTDAAAEIIPEPKWKPSIHMPRSEARLFLRVIGIRVEKLQDITTEDAEQEGIIARGCAFPRKGNIAIDTFADLWDSINFDRGSWESNPWVWVIEFEKDDLGVAE